MGVKVTVLVYTSFFFSLVHLAHFIVFVCVAVEWGVGLSLSLSPIEVVSGDVVCCSTVTARSGNDSFLKHSVFHGGRESQARSLIDNCCSRCVCVCVRACVRCTGTAVVVVVVAVAPCNLNPGVFRISCY